MQTTPGPMHTGFQYEGHEAKLPQIMQTTGPEGGYQVKWVLQGLTALFSPILCCTYTYTCVPMYIYIYLHIHVHVSRYMHNTSVWVYTCIAMYIHMSIHIDMYLGKCRMAVRCERDFLAPTSGCAATVLNHDNVVLKEPVTSL